MLMLAVLIQTAWTFFTLTLNYKNFCLYLSIYNHLHGKCDRRFIVKHRFTQYNSLYRNIWKSLTCCKITATHIYICDFHKARIQNARTRRRRKDSEDDSNETDTDLPEVDLYQLQVNTLRRYKRHYKVSTRPGMNKAQLADVSKHLIWFINFNLDLRMSIKCPQNITIGYGSPRAPSSSNCNEITNILPKSIS